MNKKYTKDKPLHIIPLGGLEEVGRNMMLFEYDEDIVIVDMGLQFPEEDMPGIDYIIPNITYLKDKISKIRGVIITHGHYDHIGAIPHLMPRLGNPPIYTRALTRGMILKRQEDFKDTPKLNIKTVKCENTIQLGVFRIEFFHVNHNIPDSMGLAIHTPVGVVIHTGDFKFDRNPIGEMPTDSAKIARFGERGVLALLSDSTSVEEKGHSISEKSIQETLEEIFLKSSGRIIAATFASLIGRIQQIIMLAEKFNRKVVVDGYSMKANVEIAKNLGYLKVRKNTLIKPQEAKNWPDNKIVILCTGAQGEKRAVLMRLANKEHRFLKIQQADTVLFSSSVVPGNERTVQGLRDTLSRLGAKVIHYRMMDIHAGGHARAEDAKMMLGLVKPKFFMPIEGSHYMLKEHAEIAKNLGVPPQNIIIADNGQVIEATPNQVKATKKLVPTNYVMVDGLGVGDVGEVVLRDRQMMAEDGMFVIIVTIDSKTSQVRGNPDIISRGFIYMRTSKELLEATRGKVKQIVAKTAGKPINWAYVKNNLRDKIGQFLFSKTQRRPMVIPVVIEV